MSDERKLLTLLTHLEEAIRTDNVEMHELVQQVREAAEQEMIVTEMAIDAPIREVPLVPGEQRIFKKFELSGETKVTLTVCNKQNQYVITSDIMPTITSLNVEVKE